MSTRAVDLGWLLKNYRPGSQGDDWTWDDEERYLLEFSCICASATPDVPVDCGTPGHYQLMLEDHMRNIGKVEFPVLLGNDGRIWDGHHRIVAARRLGITEIPVES